jgi:hypothetical protein
VLTDYGTLWLNLGDSYSSGTGGQSNLAELGARLGTGGGHKADSSKVPRARTTGIPPKNLMGIPWRVAFALQDNGWVLRNDIIWSKPNAMPTSVADRLGNRHEHVFLFSQAQHYWFDLDAIRQPYDGDRSPSRRARSGHANKPNTIARPWGGLKQPQPNMEATGVAHTAAHELGRNPGDVWTIATQPFPGAHFATMPPALARRCVLAGCEPGGIVLDPFSGSGTTGLAATSVGRRYVGIDLNKDYLDLSLRTRLRQGVLDLETGTWTQAPHGLSAESPAP